MFVLYRSYALSLDWQPLPGAAEGPGGVGGRLVAEGSVFLVGSRTSVAGFAFRVIFVWGALRAFRGIH